MVESSERPIVFILARPLGCVGRRTESPVPPLGRGNIKSIIIIIKSIIIIITVIIIIISNIIVLVSSAV